MPAVSGSQQKAAAMALAAKRGKIGVDKLQGAAKEMFHSMTQKQLEDFAKTKRSNLPEKKEEINMLDNDILTESQKKELRKIIDTLVEERVHQKNHEFIKKYTKFVAESATEKITKKIKEKMGNRIEEEINRMKKDAEKVCRSVILESASKIANVRNQQKKMVEEFKKTAPKLVKTLAEEKAKELAADAVDAIAEKERLEEALTSITKGMEKAGYVINEDIDRIIEKEKNEKRMLRTKLAQAMRDVKFSELTEGMLPAQKKEIGVLLEDCTTAEMLEDRFLIAKKKIMEEKIHIQDSVSEETRRHMDKTKSMIEEEEEFSGFLRAVSKAV